MNCSRCSVELDYPYFLPLCPGCYARISSTAERPELDASTASRTLGLWALGIQAFSGFASPWLGSMVLPAPLLTLLLAGLAVVFNVVARWQLARMDPPTHKVAKAGLVLGLFCGFLAFASLAVETHNFTRWPV